MLYRRASRTTALVSLVAVMALAGFLGACAPKKAPLAVFTAPTTGDAGVVIAQAGMVSGLAQGSTYAGNPSDCSGPGLAIKAGSSTGDKTEIFDSTGEPCPVATTLFDGNSALGRRAPDPTVQIGFTDGLGSRPDPKNAIMREDKPEQIVLNSQPQLPAALASSHHPVISSSVPAGPDTLTRILQQWSATDDLATREAARSAARSLDQAVAEQRAETEAGALAQLQSRLRESERRVQEEERRRSELARLSSTKRSQAEAELTKYQQEQQQLRAELTAIQARAEQYASEAQRLAAEKAKQEEAFQARISTLSGDLKAAERQAQAQRQQLVIAAAAKIAEAEQLASAAKLQEQEIQLREAARLKQEAEQMMERALAIKAGEGIFAPDLNAITPAAAPMALAEVPVVLQAKDKTLPELTAQILKSAAPQAGEWKSDWQLSKENNYILNEKWSLTAEAPVAALLQQLAEQVRAAHNIKLTFTQFTGSRLLVVTDE